MLKEDFEVFIQARIDSIMKKLDILIAGTFNRKGIPDDTKKIFFECAKMDCVASYKRGFFDAMQMVSTQE